MDTENIETSSNEDEHEYELVTSVDKETFPIYSPSKRKYQRQVEDPELRYEWDYPGWGSVIYKGIAPKKSTVSKILLDQWRATSIAGMFPFK